MRILCLHSNSIEYQAVKEAIKEPERIKDKKGKQEDCLVVFMASEKQDENNPGQVAKKLAEEATSIAGNVNVKNIVLYPYVHLTSEPSSPAVAVKILELAEKELKKKFKVKHSPFGWYKSFKIDVKGHPLAELSREFGPETKKRTGKDERFEFSKKKLDEVERIKYTAGAVTALAIKETWPEAAIGSIGFYNEQVYVDFAGITVRDDDIRRIEKKAKGLLRKGVSMKKEGTPKEKYQKEISKDLGKDASVYSFDGLSIVPLHKNPFVDPKKIGALKILHSASAYWRGNADNPQLTRIYCVGFKDKDDMKKYLEKLEAAEKRSHQAIGEKLGLFTFFDKVGKGLPIWLPKGETIKREIENLAVEKENEYGYVRVSTPMLAKKELFMQSGHLPYYADSMYPNMKMDDGEYYLKAMNCPMHHLIYNDTLRSYRDLPLRIAEYGVCHRNELSGALSGLQRVRSMNMNDAHMYCRKDQIEQEISSVIKLTNEYYEIFGLDDYWFRLSLSDLSSKGKYIDQPENWKDAEQKLRQVLKKMKVPFVEAKDEAAFYGPKIDIQFRNVFGKEETMSTIQLDFLAKERFGLFYIDEKGKKNHDVFVIHRSPLSTHERFMAFLIEHYEGNFPTWLNPVQARIVTIADRHEGFAREVLDKMLAKGIRAELDDRMESVGKKVHDAQADKVNYVITIGDKELEKSTLAVRSREGKLEFGLKVDDFIKELHKNIENRKD